MRRTIVCARFNLGQVRWNSPLSDEPFLALLGFPLTFDLLSIDPALLEFLCYTTDMIDLWSVCYSVTSRQAVGLCGARDGRA